MSPHAPVLVAAAECSPSAEVALERVVGRVVVVGRDTGVAEIEAVAASERVVWLPAWSRVDAELAGAIAEWMRIPPSQPRCACVRRELAVDGATLSLGPAVLLSTPGAVRLLGGEPRPRRGVDRTGLGRLRLDAPRTLAEHLAAINEETSAEARRRRDAGLRPSWRGLTVEPLLVLARAALTARGPARISRPRAVLEAYRGALLAAKLWELVHVDGRDRR
jgi:hypothetical protein